VKLDKSRFEELKEIAQLELTYSTQLIFTVEELKWLVAQVEKAERLEEYIGQLYEEKLQLRSTLNQIENLIAKSKS
jgi:hypothetical protein